jgi:hypothetical protein
VGWPDSMSLTGAMMGAIAGSLIRSWDASAGSLCGVLDRLVFRDLGDCGRSVGGTKVGAPGGDACLLLLTIGIVLLLPSMGIIGIDACLALHWIGMTGGDVWLLLLILGFCGTEGGIGGDACLEQLKIGGLGVGAFMILMISSALKREGLDSQGVLTFIEEAESGG